MSRSICFVGLDNYPILNPQYGQAYFGGESVQQTLLAHAFAAKGYEVSMVVKDHGQPQGEVRDGVRVLKTFAESDGVPVLRFVHPRLTSIQTALKAANADTYYQSCAGMLTGAVAWHCARQQRRFVFRLAHDTDCIPGEQLIAFWRDRKLYEYGLRRADHIAAQGVRQIALLKQHYGLPSTMVNMAVEPPEHGPGERDIDVLWVNNLRPFKQPERVVSLARALPQTRFVMIGGAVPGNSELFEKVRAQADDLDNLEFLGAVPYHEVNAYFQRSRVFINTSDHEGFPNSFLQAWIRGTPVLSFFDPDGLIEAQRLGGCPGDMDEMVIQIAALLEDADARAAMARRCEQYAQAHYSPQAVAATYEQLGMVGDSA